MTPATPSARGLTGLALSALLGLVVAGFGCSKRDRPTAPSTSSGSQVTGMVKDTLGAPVPNALVSLTPASGPMPLIALRLRDAAAASSALSPEAREAAVATEPVQVAPTDANGAFTFHHVAPGDYIISAIAANHLADSKALTVADGGAQTVVQLRLRATGVFTGRATLDAATDHHGTVVYVQGTSAVALTDADGNYELEDVPLGTWTVTASRASYLDASESGTLATEGEIVALADMELRRDLNVPPTATITSSSSCSLEPVRLMSDADDPDGTIVLYEWDLDDDGTIDTTGDALVEIEHRYAPGPYRARLIVTDDHGARAVAVHDFTLYANDTLYVSSSTGTPAGPGTRAAPFSTLDRVLFRGGQPGVCRTVVLVAVGTYAEGVVFSSNQEVHGGFDPATWERTPGARTSVWVGSARAIADGVESTVITDMEFVSAGATTPGTSSVVLTVEECPSIRFERCRFAAGSGGTGSSGPNGSSGAAGYAGFDASGQAGGRFPSYPSWPSNLPRGTDGPLGPYPGESPAPGDTGYTQPASCMPAGGFPGPAGTTACFGAPLPGGNGGDGQPGPDGIGGSGPIAAGNFTGFQFKRASGATGTSGCGGSGSGSGGAGGATCAGHVDAGSPGGGGGSGSLGGGGGHPGLGGRVGGGSFAVMILDANPEFIECAFATDMGGAGGEGGAGGVGGEGKPGGKGGTVPWGGAAGGAGGMSGGGGRGGGGQGGPGGPSWCVVKLGTANPTLISPTFQPGAGGTGGLGGRVGGTGERAAPGPDGPSGAIYPASSQMTASRARR